MRDVETEQQLEQNHEEAFGWALSCCRWDRQVAEDVLQTAYLKVLDGRAKFGGRSSFKTWLFSVIRMTASEYRRKQVVQRFVPFGEEQEQKDQDPTNSLDDMVRSEGTKQLIAALAKLPRRQREILQLVFYHDMTIREAAGVAKISIGSARTHYERGKTRMRKLLAAAERS